MNEPFELRHDNLPPALRAAPEEFAAWSQKQLSLEEIASTPDQPLYHYTGKEAFKGILQKQSLWCFRHLHQRDRTEFEYSLAIARQAIRKIGQTDDFYMHHFCGCLDDLLETNSLTDVLEFYLFSLSRHRDDKQQWVEYGQAGQGFAIGFAPLLFQPEKRELSEQANENVFVGRIAYGDVATEQRHRLAIERAAGIVSRIGNANRDAITKTNLVPFLRSVALEVIASQLVWDCLTAKSMVYANEQEVRYLILNVSGKFDALRKSFNGKDYVETPLPLKAPGSIVEVLVGPLASIGAEAKVAKFLEEHGYSADIRIGRSSVTLDSSFPEVLK